MDARMTRPTNPHPLTEIQVSPVMIDQLHRPMSFAQFAAFITRIRPLTSHFPMVFPVAVANPMLPHIISGGSTNRITVGFSILKIHPSCARLTAVVSSIRSLFVNVELVNWQRLFAAIATGGRRRWQAFNQARTFDRTTSTLDFMGWWRQKRFAAVRTGHFNLTVIPRAMAFGKFITRRSIHALNDTP